MRIIVKSKYIHYGQRVDNKEIEVSKDELEMLDKLGVKYELIKSKEKTFDKNQVQE